MTSKSIVTWDDSLETLTIRGNQYKTKSVEGDLELQTLFSYTEVDEIDDPEQKKKLALTLRNLIIDVPDTIINNDGQVKLFHKEYVSILNFFKLKYCRENLALAKELNDLEEEQRFAAIQSRVLAMVNRDKKPIEYDEDGFVIDRKTPPISNEDKFRYHKQYYEQQIQESSDQERTLWLQQRLTKITSDYQTKTGNSNGIPSQIKTELEKENEMLKIKLAELGTN
jgi:hypothetical protein